ncbi:hypothetical protein B0H13DRAFT_1905834 [Mycena leptocephala]|nr:hypothetical protein B0H13DRAFT_1905834 [Mycena leptocephala]
MDHFSEASLELTWDSGLVMSRIVPRHYVGCGSSSGDGGCSSFDGETSSEAVACSKTCASSSGQKWKFVASPTILIPSSHRHLVPTPACALTGFAVVMDESQFSPLFWDGSSEVEQRQHAHSSSAPAAGVMPSFAFSTDPGFSTDFGHFYPLTGFFSAPNSWDSALFSLLPRVPQEMSTQWDDPAVQTHWDDFVSSLQPAPARPPSTDSNVGNFFYDAYGADPSGRFSDDYSSSRFSSAPPSSIPDDDGWSSRVVMQQFTSGLGGAVKCLY